MDEREPGKLEQLQKDLYSREYHGQDEPTRAQLGNPSSPVEHEWKQPGPAIPAQAYSEYKIPSPSPLKKILIGAALFFVLAAGIAAYVFFWGINIVSTDKVDISFVGPVSVAAGEPQNFEVVIVNNNNASLVNATLYLDYPDGTKEVADTTKDLAHETETIAEVPSKATIRHPIGAIFYGEQGESKQIKAVLEYSVKSSNGSYRKEKIVDINLKSSPLTVTISGPKEISSGNTAEFSIEVTSNASTPLKNLLLKAEFPTYGFIFSDAVPKATFDNNTWLITTLAPGEKKTFTVRGRVEGLENDERVARFNIGLRNPNNDKQIITLFLSKIQSVLVRRPMVSTDLSFDGVAADQFVITTTNDVDGRLSLVNNMPTQLLDAQVKIVFGGQVLDPKSPTGVGGIYRQTDKTLIWDRNTAPALASIDPGSQIDFTFLFRTLSPEILKNVKNGSVTMTITISGKQIDSSGVSSAINQVSTKQLKYQTNASLVARLFYTSGPFKNTGPIPPKVDAKTTYTIVWSVINSMNPLTNAEVTARLPAYVNWLGVISPSTEKENIIWDPERRIITWKLNDVKAAGTAAAREVYMQVELQPSNAQLNSIPSVLTNGRFTATDSFTTLPVSIEMNQFTTSLSSDPKVSNKSGIVRK